MTGYLTSLHLLDHRTTAQHPERPDRLRAIAVAVRQAGLIDSPNPFPQFHMDFGAMPMATTKLLEMPEPRRAEEKWVELVHPKHHIDHIRQFCESGGGVIDQTDTPVCDESFEIALRAVGALLDSCDAVVEGKLQRAFAAIRPPGHHAEPERAMGFCLFANISIAARYLQKRYGVGKVAIVDFDVHHGNGTQAVFEADPSVLFISLHQDPQTCYPGTGYASETGKGEGLGTTLNIPMKAGIGDVKYLEAFHARALPAIDAFKPEMLLISAGFDAHVDDPLARIYVTEEGFGQMTELLVQAANTHTGGRIISALEGGYDLRALGRSVVWHLKAMA